MLHAQIESEEVIERYVRNQLSLEERNAFEEHFFTCDECFEKLEATERFVAGVRDAAEHGRIDEEPETRRPGMAGGWLRWAFAACACAAVAIGALSGWMFFSRIPGLNRELDEARLQLQSQRQTLAKLQQGAGPTYAAEANVPLVILQGSRGQEESRADLPAGARQLVVWIEIGPTRYRTYRLEIFSPSNQSVATLDNLKPGPYGALAASLPAAQLPAGEFRVRLMGQDPPPASLVGEYRLQIRQP